MGVFHIIRGGVLMEENQKIDIPEVMVEDIEGYIRCDSAEDECMTDCWPASYLLSQNN